MERRSWLLSMAGAAVVIVSPRGAEGRSVVTRITRVSGFSVFAGPHLIEDLKPGTPLQVIHMQSRRAHAAVYAFGEQVGTISLDSLGIMSWRAPEEATVHLLSHNEIGKHDLWITCAW